MRRTFEDAIIDFTPPPANRNRKWVAVFLVALGLTVPFVGGAVAKAMYGAMHTFNEQRISESL